MLQTLRQPDGTVSLVPTPALALAGRARVDWRDDLWPVPDATIATLVARSLKGRVFEVMGAFFAHEGCQEDPRPRGEHGSLAGHARGAFSLRLISRAELDDLERIHAIVEMLRDGVRTFEEERVATACARLIATGTPRRAEPRGEAAPRLRFLGAAQAIGEALESRSLQLANIGRAAHAGSSRS